jgi:hypothetical protein
MRQPLNPLSNFAQRNPPVAVQLVRDLPFEAREGQLMCERFGPPANKNFSTSRLGYDGHDATLTG